VYVLGVKLNLTDEMQGWIDAALVEVNRRHAEGLEAAFEYNTRTPLAWKLIYGADDVPTALHIGALPAIGKLARDLLEAAAQADASLVEGPGPIIWILDLPLQVEADP